MTNRVSKFGYGTAPPRWRRLHEIVSHLARIYRANIEMAETLGKHRPFIAAIRIVLVLVLCIIPFLMGWSSGHVIESVAAGSGIGSYRDPAILGLALALIVSGALPLIMAVLDRVTENWAFTYVQQAQVQKVPEIDPVTYSDPELKDKIQQVQERAVWRIMAFMRAQVMLARAVLLTLVAAWMLGTFSSLAVLAIVVAMLPSMMIEGRHAFRQFKVDESQHEWWRRFWEDRDNIMNSKKLAYLQVFGAAHWFADRFAQQIGEAIDQYDQLERSSITTRVASMAVGMIAVVGVAVGLIVAVVHEQLTVAQFVFQLSALSLLAASLAEIAALLGQQLGQSLYVESFGEVLAINSRTHYPHSSSEAAASVTGLTLELDRVRFAYPLGAERTGREVIRGVSLTVPAGEKWAIVGMNGAGKSTLKSLIVRLFDPTSGQVRYSGVPATDFSRSELRQLVSCLPQDIQHYNLRVAEFIALGRAGEDIDMERIQWAARRSGAASFVEQYRDGYWQRLGRDYIGSEEPSGGQLQKLALASLLYTRAKLLVLDEPTAAIDPESARDFWNTLFNECPGQTVVFSTHYLGAVRRADCIVVLEQGEVLAQGHHDELVHECAAYRQLFESQARDYQKIAA